MERGSLEEYSIYQLLLCTYAAMFLINVFYK